MMSATFLSSASVCVCPRPAVRFAPSRCVQARAGADDDVSAPTPAPAAPVSPPAEAPKPSTSASLTLDQQIYRTLAPRVSELRGKQLSKGLTNPLDIWSFYGPLPELLNSRLAMLGFIACMGAEYVSHESLVQQVSDAPKAIMIAFTTIAIASLIPIIRGSNILDDGSGEGTYKLGSFNVTNELINGRAAMLGFAIVAIYETATGSPLFN